MTHTGKPIYPQDLVLHYVVNLVVKMVRGVHSLYDVASQFYCESRTPNDNSYFFYPEYAAAVIWRGGHS